jgi:hypothetical protein
VVFHHRNLKPGSRYLRPFVQSLHFYEYIR